MSMAPGVKGQRASVGEEDREDKHVNTDNQNQSHNK